MLVLYTAVNAIGTKFEKHFSNDNEDQFDSIAPATQNTERQDASEGTQDLHALHFIKTTHFTPFSVEVEEWVNRT